MSQSFYRYNSFKNSISAADVVIASSILLDSYKRRNVEDASSAEISEAAVGAVDDGAVTSTSMGSDAFYEAYSCLSRFSDDVLKKGINNALLIQKVVCKRIFNCAIDCAVLAVDVGQKGHGSG